MKSVLITGASSYLGRSLATVLIKNGYKVYPTVNKNISRLSNEIKLNLLNFDKRVLPTRVDFIIHLAAKTGSSILEGDQETFKINVDGTLHLAQYAKQVNVRKFIYLSTASVYKPGGVSTENITPIAPRNFYSLTKWLGEEVVHYYSKYFSILILRLAYPYGLDGNKSLIGRLFNKIRQDEKVQIHPTGSPALNPIYIDDLTTAVIKGLNLKENLTINVAGPQVLNIQQIVNLLAKKLKVKPNLDYVSTPVKDEVVNINLMKKHLAEPKVTLERAIKILWEI